MVLGVTTMKQREILVCVGDVCCNVVLGVGGDERDAILGNNDYSDVYDDLICNVRSCDSDGGEG